MALEPVVFVSIGVALFFAFWNGFTDAANAIATIVGTRVLKPIQAVTLSAVGNFIGMFFGVAVATTIARGIVPESFLSSYFVMAAVLGGLAYDVITYYFSLPVSESHVLIGGLIGAGIAAGGLSAPSYDSIVSKVLIPMVTSPLIAFVTAIFLSVVIIRVFLAFGTTPEHVNRYSSIFQIISSFFFSVTHGTNDAQKTMGIITGILLFHGLVSAGSRGELPVPFWVILAAHASISFGTFLGGWRIVRTMGFRITKLRPHQGFSAESSAGLVLAGTALIGFPVSTTHAISGAVMGVGAFKRLSAVKWGVARRIVYAWILTIPMAAIFAYAAFSIMKILVGI